MEMIGQIINDIRGLIDYMSAYKELKRLLKEQDYVKALKQAEKAYEIRFKIYQKSFPK